MLWEICMQDISFLLWREIGSCYAGEWDLKMTCHPQIQNCSDLLNIHGTSNNGLSEQRKDTLIIKRDRSQMSTLSTNSFFTSKEKIIFWGQKMAGPIIMVSFIWRFHCIEYVKKYHCFHGVLVNAVAIFPLDWHRNSQHTLALYMNQWETLHLQRQKD